MDENTISKLSLNEELRDVEDETLRKEIINTGLRGHTILDSNNTEFPTRSKLQIKYGNLIDDPINNKTIISPKENIIVDKPTINVGEYTYNGEPQGPEIIGLTDDMIVQNATNINSGTYQLIISLKEAPIAFWSDSTTAPIVVEYTISRLKINIPSISDNFVYDGSEKKPTIIDFNPELMTKNGTESSINAGTYSILFDIKSQNYEWSDGTNSTKYIEWIIEKADSIITIDSTDPIILTAVDSTKTIPITVQGIQDVQPNIDPYQSDIIVILNKDDTENIESFTISKGALIFGEYTITFEIQESDNYKYTSKTIHLFIDAVPELNECTWEQISEISHAGMASTFWNIGDYKEIELNGNVGDYLTLTNYKTCVYIIGFDHNVGMELKGITFGCFKRKYSSGMDDLTLQDNKYFSDYKDGEKTFNINHWKDPDKSYTYNYGGWAASDIRYDILGSTDKPPTYYGSYKREDAAGLSPSYKCATSPKENTLLSTFPYELRQYMRAIVKYTFNYENEYSPTSDDGFCNTTDYLPLMSEMEIFGSATHSHSRSSLYHKQYDYYKNGNSVLKDGNITGSGSGYWTRDIGVYNSSSPSFTNEYGFVEVYASGSAAQTNLSYSSGLSPIFLV